MAVQNGYRCLREIMDVKTMKLKRLALQFVHIVFVGIDLFNEMVFDRLCK